MSSKYNLFNPTPFETHMIVYDKIRGKSSVLDVGCATGYYACKLVDKKCIVWGIDSNRQAIHQAKKYCAKVIQKDLDELENFEISQKFDYILVLDVLEHMKNPGRLLVFLKNYLKKKGKMIISTPNIAFISIRLALLIGRFKYKREGILDENHLHFYTRNSFQDLLKTAGLKIDSLQGSSAFSQIPKFGRYLNLIPKKYQFQITNYLPGLLSYQLIAETSLT